MSKKLTWTVVVVAALQFAGSFRVQALTVAESKQIKHAVLGVPLPELPAKATQVVAKAEMKDQSEVAVLVVKTIVAKNKAVATAVVAAISKAYPELAGVVAAAAAELDKSQAVAIADAAGMAAPMSSAEIAALVTKVVPERAAAIKPAAFRGFASVSASAFTFTTKKGPIVNPLASLTLELKQRAAASLGITVAQLEALAEELPINFEFTGANSVTVTIPLPLQPDGSLSQSTKDEILNTDGTVNVTKVREISKPIAAPPAVEITYGTPRT